MAILAEWRHLCAEIAILEQEIQRTSFSLPSPRMQQLLIVAEDRRLGYHPGADVIALGRAAWCTWFRGARQGGSTIAMQLVRTLTGKYQRNMRRKIVEVILAILLTRKASSERLPLLYLWCAYYGWRMNGFPAACRRLHMDPAHMDLRDEAELVARLKYPQPREPSSARMNTIAHRGRHLEALLLSGRLPRRWGNVVKPDV